MAERDGNTGRIVEIKGVVIDAVFPDRLPEIMSALEIELETGTLVAEVQQHLGDDRVRAVAMDSTDGLARGLEVVDTGGPISVPVGEPTLGRLWNVIGQAIDGGDVLAADAERWPIHRDPPAFRDLSPKIEIFETGLKVVEPRLAHQGVGRDRIGIVRIAVDVTRNDQGPPSQAARGP